MFFFSNEYRIADSLVGMTDYHSHILHGVDDGLKTIDESLLALSYLESLGLKKVVCTPHIMNDYPLNNTKFLREKFNELCNSYSGSIKLSLGAEYMLDSSFRQHLDTEDLLPIHGNFLLVETSYLTSSLNFLDLIKSIHSKGYHIILAHPERYTLSEADYEYLKSHQVLFQLNLLSICNVYGNRTRRVATKLLLKDYYDCIGTDLHNADYFKSKIGNLKLTRKMHYKLDEIKDRACILG